MATGQANRIVDQLRWIVHDGGQRTRTDGQLLDGFIGRQDESAFAEIVRRHGPMVYGLCKRLLGNAHDAEDAFQATFMVLVRRARAVSPRELVGNWLYGVAYRVALDAASRVSRRRAREKQVVDMPHPTTTPEDAADLRPVLDLELSRMPEKYRVPIVLCELEGRSRREVARQLHLPEGTLSSRLAAGRKMLAIRLARHGLPLSGAALCTFFSGGAAQAMVPGSLAVSTIKAAAAGAAVQAVSLGLLSAQAAALTEGALKAMFITKLKSFAAVLLTLGMLTSGAGIMTLTADEPRPGGEAAQANKQAAPGAGGAQKPAAPGAGLAFGDLDGDGWPDLFIQQGQPFLLRWQKKSEKDTFDHLAAVHHSSMRKLVNCQACHHAQLKDPNKVSEEIDRLVVEKLWKQYLGIPDVPLRLKPTDGGQSGDILVIRIPKKSTPATDAEFLRRLCLDLAGRTPTLLEMHYFLKDTDPQKHKMAVSKLAGDSGAVQIMDWAAKPPTRESRAEDYVKEKLGKNQLTPEERQLVQKVLEFTEKERPK